MSGGKKSGKKMGAKEAEQFHSTMRVKESEIKMSEYLFFLSALAMKSENSSSVFGMKWISVGDK